MARMIPEHLSEATKSRAEEKLFRLFQQMSETDDWVIMHSVAIAKHPPQSQGESDFVVLIPDHAVLVLEIKGGGISYRSGTWYSCDRYNEIHEIKNPVDEANNAMHALKKYLDECNSELRAGRIIFGFGVVFPDSEVCDKLHLPDLANEQIADINTVMDADCAKNYLLRLCAFWKKRFNTASRAILPPSAAQCKEIVNLLRPEYSSHISLSTIICGIEGQALKLTQNQQYVLDGLKDNERCLVAGSAGTGKTVLAVQIARDIASTGQSVAFFCYNRRLANYLCSNLGDANIVCGSFTDYMDSFVERFRPEAKQHSLDEEGQDDYYRKRLPDLFSELCLDGIVDQLDYLIIDEAQDLMTDDYLETLDLLLKGGLKDGNWRFFMDGEKQNIYHANMSYNDIRELLRRRHIYFSTYILTDNCRNSLSIIKKVDHVFGSQTRSLQDVSYGEDVKVIKYKRNNEQATAVEALLLKLYAEGIAPDQIVILSPVRLENSAVAQICNNRFSISETPQKDGILFCTIDGFKGLESSVVVLTDIYSLDSEKRLNRLYVGMTRAKSLLYIFANEKSFKQVN